MKPTPPIEEFLHGAAETAKPKRVTIAVTPDVPIAKKRGKRFAPGLVEVAPAPDPGLLRQNVVFRLRLADIRELKERAHRESMQTGRRVTQQALVDAALAAFLYSKKS
jgi:hypothetical protein